MSCQEWRGMEGVLQAGSLRDVATSFLIFILSPFNTALELFFYFQHITSLSDFTKIDISPKEH